MALGVKWPVLVTHEGDARVSVKTCYWDFFFGGMRLVTWDVSTFAYVPVDKGRVYRCVENTRWVHGPMPRLNDSWRLINRHSQRWSAQLHPICERVPSPPHRGVFPSRIHWPRRKLLAW